MRVVLDKSQIIKFFAVIWIAVCILFNFELVEDLHVSTIMLVFLILVWFSLMIRYPLNLLMPGIFLAGYLVYLLIQSLIVYPNNVYNYSESVNIALLVLGAAAFKGFYEKYLFSISVVIPFLIAMLVVYVFITNQWNYYDTGRGRFGIPTMGSPNSLSFVLAVGLVLLHYFYINNKTFWVSCFSFITFVCMLVAILAAQSRGGLLLFFLGAVLLAKQQFRVYMILLSVTLFFIAALYIPDDSFVVKDRNLAGTTGRLDIWLILLSKLSENTLTLMIGNGPGMILLDRDDGVVNSAHSIPVTILYSYGVAGLLIMLVVIFKLYWSRLHSVNSLEGRYRKILFSMIFLSSFYDSYLLNAQLLWFNAIVLGLVFSSDSRMIPNQNEKFYSQLSFRV